MRIISNISSIIDNSGTEPIIISSNMVKTIVRTQSENGVRIFYNDIRVGYNQYVTGSGYYSYSYNNCCRCCCDCCQDFYC